MFKKVFPNSSGNTSNYAFTSGGAINSSSNVKKKESENIYQPLPAPRHIDSHQTVYSNSFSDSHSRGGDSLPTTPRIGELRGNPHTPSPNQTPSRSLLAGASPVDPSSPTTASGRFTNTSSAMPTSQRFGATSRASSGISSGIGNGMPSRGESQSALLGNGSDRSLSNARRYGPTASSAPVGPNAALLGSPAQSVSDRQNMVTDSTPWTQGIDTNPEADDFLHNPDPKRDRNGDHGGSIFTSRGVVNIGCLSLLLLGIITLFAGYPIITFYTQSSLSTNGGFNLGGINSTGQVPQISNFAQVIDPETPSSAMQHTGFDGKTYDLVFSDEFNKDGRTFYDGDDPFWTAVDLHYWPTGDFEWYDPSAITTKDGNLVITMTQEPIHDLNFKSGMLQSWNKMCFSMSVYIEVRISIPGTPAIGGFWPGVWMMGNLGRPGYGASTEGMWPYTYDSCDIGTLKNQTTKDGTGPPAALVSGNDGGGISFLPGQRTSACTCAGEDHPGPSVDKGRGVPEIDIIEGQTDLSIANGRGQASQSAQIAPFDDYYQYGNGTGDATQYDMDLTKWNSYKGGVYQEAASSLVYLDRDDYQLTSGGFGVFGFEYYANPSDRDAGYITWLADGQKSWTMQASSVGPNSRMQIGQRLVSEEPMAMVINFGMSNNFQTVNFADLTWPATFLIDYVRVYQTGDGDIGCNPDHHPTSDYINAHLNAYSNPNLTVWSDAGYTMPKNSLIDNC